MRFAGVYEGVVADNQDPNNQCRVRVRVSGINDAARVEQLPWARVSVPFVGVGQGQIRPPMVGSEVLVAFRDGHPDFPVVMGCWLTNQDTLNAPDSAYKATDAQDVTEANETSYVGGDRTTVTQGGRTEFVGGEAKLESNSQVEQVSGKVTREIGSLFESVKGQASVSVLGPLEAKIYEIGLAVVRKLAVSIGDKGIDLQSLGGITLTSILTPAVIESIAGNVRLATRDPLNIADVAAVETGVSGVGIKGLQIKLGALTPFSVAYAEVVQQAILTLAAAFDAHFHVESSTPVPIPGMIPATPTLTSLVMGSPTVKTQ